MLIPHRRKAKDREGIVMLQEAGNKVNDNVGAD
jgi:hypothetical protein